MDKKAVSPDSSTQITEKKKKSKKRKHKHRSKSGKSKKFKSSSSSQDIESDSTKTESKRNKSDSESITPLTEFLDDKAELHEQLFTIISKKEVKEMMPDILKKLSFKEVKNLCSEQLQLLSKRQLESIIIGKELDSSEDESSEEPENREKLEVAQEQHEKEDKIRKLDSDSERKQERIQTGREEEKKENDMIIFQEMITIPNQEEIDELVGGRSAMQENNKGDPGQFDGPTADEEAELKELEFRARALESLVRARERQMKIEQG